uniref:Uncharacterized protein n=1 Tax=Hordeum vulgare subsp. vulgare TaxID=112509 RepID=A0A8I6YUX9_HORVV
MEDGPAYPRLHVLESAVVAPSPTPPAPETSLPLTFLDVLWLNAPPVERVFFYRLAPGPTPAMTSPPSSPSSRRPSPTLSAPSTRWQAAFASSPAPQTATSCTTTPATASPSPSPSATST